MAGETNAPLAAMVGDDPARPRLLTVRQPRNRSERFAFAAELAAVLLRYLDGFTRSVQHVAADRGRDTRLRYTEAEVDPRTQLVLTSTFARPLLTPP